MNALQRFVSNPDSMPSNGITAVLVARIQSLGWHVTVTGHLEDSLGVFSLFQCCMSELLFRAELAWLRVVAAAVSHRPGFQQLDRIDPARTRRFLSSLSPSDAAAFRKLLNGAHVTQDGKHYCQESDTDVCDYCECSDSRFHRFWGCQAFDSCRVGVDPALWNFIPELPECVTCHGWALSPTTLHEWREYLVSLMPLGLPVMPVAPAGLMHVFVDGTCCNPNYYPDARVAAYAVVWADPQSIAHAKVLDQGPLPGLCQTSVRAEIYAVLRATQFAARWGVSLMLWSDCLSVVRRFRKIAAGQEVRINSPNADLWLQFHEAFWGCAVPPEITKVQAHRDALAAPTALEEWCYLHNSFADRAAAYANSARGSDFWKLFSRHVNACKQIDEWNGQIQQVLLRTSRMVLQNTMPRPQVEPPVVAPPPGWIHLPGLPQPPAQAVKWYGLPVVRSLMRWFWDGIGDGSHPVQWVAHAQLFIDFGCSTGLSGPVKLDGWKDGSDIPLLQLLPISFKTRVRWFGKVLKEILRHLGLPLQSGYHRPASAMISMFASCVAVPWPCARLDATDRWLAQWTVAPFRRQSRDMDRLPPPGRDAMFPA